jgi:hypothetical protein
MIFLMVLAQKLFMPISFYKILHKNNMNYLIKVVKLFKNIHFKVEWFELDSILELVRTFIP